MKDIKNPAASGDTQLSSILLLKCLQNLIHLACHLISPWKPRFFSLLHSNCVRPPAFGDEVGYFLQMTESLVYAHRVGWGFNLCFICLFYLFLFGSKTAVIFPFKKKVCMDSCMLKSCCRMCRVKVPRAERADTRACVHTDMTDGRGRTDGQTGSTVAHTPTARLVPRGACTAVPAHPASACVCVHALQVRSHSKPKLVHACPHASAAWAPSPQGTGWGAEGG